ncbi:hypothetical protein RQP46_005815 [Phenoliferia psychrophenolica]
MPLAPTSLLSLPNELLVKIARHVAPDGGRKAGNLRLVCRHLGRVVAPVTWASIVLPTDLDELDEIGDELLTDCTGHNSLIIDITDFTIIALVACGQARRVHLDADFIVPGIIEHLMDIHRFGSPTKPCAFELVGATKLFMDSPPNDPATPLIVRILNWVALGLLTTLTLPVFGTFYTSDALASLSLPRVQILVLDVDQSSLHILDPDLFESTDSISNYTQLVRFLKLASLPSLSTLSLRHWISPSNISTFARTPIHDLPAESPLIFGLLGFLRTTTVMELRLENSTGADGDVQCIFSREMNGEWSSRLARFW